ncbi:hypothetical protein Tco_0215921 [Tanacetum coccineum]
MHNSWNNEDRKDIVNLIVNSSMDFASVNVHECEKCLKLETELQKDFVEKEIYDKLFKRFTTLEKHCISLEVDTQLNQEIFQRDNSISNQSALSFDQLFELKLIESTVPREIMESLVITTLKDELRKLKGKDLANNEVTHHPSDPEINTEPITPPIEVESKGQLTLPVLSTHRRTQFLGIFVVILKQIKSLRPNPRICLVLVACFPDNPDMCVLDYINNVTSRATSKSVKKTNK